LMPFFLHKTGPDRFGQTPQPPSPSGRSSYRSPSLSAVQFHRPPPSPSLSLLLGAFPFSAQ
jgi:hypothetical protein